jgi:hypothetical protein
MEKTFKLVHNVELGEITEIELTEQEIADLNDDGGMAAKKQQEAAAKEAAQSKLAALGLTTEDLKALGL